MAKFEQLAYKAALRSLDKQERLLEELRARTGVLLAASSIAASFLGQQAFRHPGPGALVAVALLAFVVSTRASVFVLMPKRELVFAEAGSELFERHPRTPTGADTRPGLVLDVAPAAKKPALVTAGAQRQGRIDRVRVSVAVAASS